MAMTSLTSPFTAESGRDCAVPFRYVNVFNNLTLFENVCHPRSVRGEKVPQPVATVARDKYVQAEVETILDRVGLLSQSHVAAQALSHGDQRSSRWR